MTADDNGDVEVPIDGDAAAARTSLTDMHLFDPDTVASTIASTSSLAARFGLPPFTLLDGRSGWWQQRKGQWADMGLRSEKGRDAKTFAKGEGDDEVSQKILALTGGQSIFDPVLCEMAYRWFVPMAGTVLDPFAGGSVRGLVAATTGRRYTGIDLSERQVKANLDQADTWVESHVFSDHLTPTYVVGDADTVLDDHDPPPGGYDFVWSCPPYHDLEQYSDDPADLSNMSWRDFLKAYRRIISKSVDMLADDRFCGFVVGEIRDKQGFYRNFVGETIMAFEKAGAAYYNEALLVSPAGTLPLRAAKQFTVSRKMGRTHQTVLLFVKGDPKEAAAACDPTAMAAIGMDDPDVDAPDEDYSGVGHG